MNWVDTDEIQARPVIYHGAGRQSRDRRWSAHGMVPAIALLQACKQTYLEGLSELYRGRAFVARSTRATNALINRIGPNGRRCLERIILGQLALSDVEGPLHHRVHEVVGLKSAKILVNDEHLTSFAMDKPLENIHPYCVLRGIDLDVEPPCYFPPGTEESDEVKLWHCCSDAMKALAEQLRGSPESPREPYDDPSVSGTKDPMSYSRTQILQGRWQGCGRKVTILLG